MQLMVSPLDNLYIAKQMTIHQQRIVVRHLLSTTKKRRGNSDCQLQCDWVLGGKEQTCFADMR